MRGRRNGIVEPGAASSRWLAMFIGALVGAVFVLHVAMVLPLSRRWRSSCSWPSPPARCAAHGRCPWVRP